MKIFTSTGVGKENTVKKFVPISSVYWDEDPAAKHLLWLGGGKVHALSRLLDGQEDKSRIEARQGSKENIYEVEVKRIAEFINREVATRRSVSAFNLG